MEQMELVYRYVEDHAEEYIRLLKAFIAQPSVSITGEGISGMAELAAKTLEQIGAKAELIHTAGNPIVYGECMGGGEKTLTFYNHYDVQPVDPVEAWDTPPFVPTERSGRLYGRGTADNKGSLLARVAAVDAYRKVCGALPCNVKFIMEGEEETGSPNLAWFRDSYPEKMRTDALVWEGGSRDVGRGAPQINLGFKGTCGVELRCSAIKGDMHSSLAAIIPSAVWRLIWALDTLRAEDGRVTIDHFYDDVIQPTEEDLGDLDRFTYDEEKMKAGLGLGQFVGGCTGRDLKRRYIYEPSITVCGIESGWTGEGSKTILPASAMCKLDIRLVAGQHSERIPGLLREHLDRRGFTDIEITAVKGGKDAFRTDKDSEIVKIALDSARKVYGMEPSFYRTFPGATAMGTVCGPTGIPAVCFGCANDESRMHAPNENIYLEDFIQGIKMAATVIDGFGKGAL